MERRDRVKWVYASKDNDELVTRYDQWAADYDADLKDVFGWISPEKAAKIFSNWVPKEARVLDAGAGTGLVGEALAAMGYSRIVAADLSEEMLEEARKKKVYCEYHRFILGERLAFKTDAFDAVISVGVFTLGHAPASAFDELVRIVKPGGHIVFTLRVDHYETGGFKEKQTDLERRGRWVLTELSAPYQALPKGEPEVLQRVWAYRVL